MIFGINIFFFIITSVYKDFSIYYLEGLTDRPVTPISGKPVKLREAQLQLQRKLQQREHIKDQKHRYLDNVIQVYNIVYNLSIYTDGYIFLFKTVLKRIKILI